MTKRICINLDEETFEMLKNQSDEYHMSRSSLIRFLLVRNDNKPISINY